jgi:hypothetical protein
MLSPKALDRSLGLRSSGRRTSMPYGAARASFTGSKSAKAPSESAKRQKAPASGLKYRLQRDPETGAVALLIQEV